MTAVLLAAVLTAFPLPPVGEPPAWVEQVEIPTTKIAPDGASRLLLDDTQVRVGKTVEEFQHRAWKVLSQTGVGKLAKQEFEWDPSWEQLQLHGVWIWRDGARRVAWDPEDARVIQRESLLDVGMYDGRLTLIIELRDLREGDVVEVASTRSGENPVFQGRYANRQYQSWMEPTERSRFRLSWERPRPLQVKTHGGAQTPTVSGEPGHQVFEWNLKRLEAAHLEPSMPADVEPAPYVEFSDWTDWAEVATWADTLFTVPAPGERFGAEVERFKNLPEAERARAIVRFVQDDVRYVGVEIGENSHRPHPPEWVLERGFGDCKDKSLLLVALLRAAGLEAWPALVHATGGLRLPKFTPSPDAFNHAIVQVALPGGPRFIDPTMTLRRGELEQMPQPRYHHALTVKPGVAALDPIPLDVPSTPTWELQQHWAVPTRQGTATLTITTTARGHEASTLRRQVKSTTQEQLTKTQRRSREDDLERKLTPVELSWTDDEGAEVFVLKEKYETTNFFVGDAHRFLTIAASRDLKPLERQERTWPFAIWYPLRVREIITYESADEVPGGDFALTNRVVAHPAFQLAVSQQVSGHTLKLQWDVHTLKDRVSPAEVTSYRRATAEAWALMAYTVRPNTSILPDLPELSDEPGWTDEHPYLTGFGAVGSGLLMMLVLVFVARSNSRSWREAGKTGKQKPPSPGELASNPVKVRSLEAGVGLFTSLLCPRGHSWKVVDESETVRLGEEQITVLTRRCCVCEEREDRYVKLE